MAGRDPNRPQLDFPALVADIIRDLRLTGQVGLLDFSDVVQPVYIVSSRAGALGLTVSNPVYTSAVVLGTNQTNPIQNLVLLDTGPLPAGNYDIWAMMSYNGVVVGTGFINLQHRDAANTTTLSNIMKLPMTATALAASLVLPPIGYVIALNERLRFQLLGSAVTGAVTASFGFNIRPTP